MTLTLVPKTQTKIARDKTADVILAIKVAMRDTKADIAKGRPPRAVVICFLQEDDKECVWPSWITGGCNFVEALGVIKLVEDGILVNGIGADAPDHDPNAGPASEIENDEDFAMNDDDEPPGAA